MGEHEGCAQPPSGILHNGLLPNEAASVMRVLDMERWLKAEERTAELIACIQPNPPSEERRHAVADYVQRLIMKCFPCQVFTFGSVPLKTYLPDGDIDLTAFSKNQTLKDAWAHQVHDMLQNEEKDENAEFHVKEVQYIQAEVKIIKCLVENIVVDISFNQLGGLCTLCFLEEVDNLINQNHLFKRSIILIKAWCYYESRILGAHHGLISTYALETLVLYIFHVFNNSFAGPLEVLYRFLEFFSKFDWDNFCVSLWGPVPISSLPDVTAEPPRKDGGDLLLSKLFLDACSSVYAVFPAGQENQGQPFTSKHFNVIDPLRVNNNLGRSVSKGNFFRIRSAFAFGAKRLAKLLDCPKEDLFLEVNQFFMNTWVRHGTGQRPDASSNDLWRLTLSSHDQSHGSDNLLKNSNKTENTCNHEFQVKGVHASQSVLSQHSILSSKSLSKSSGDSTANQNNAKNFEQVKREANCNQGARVDKGQRNAKPKSAFNDVPGRLLFARTCSSPELTDSYGEIPRQGRHAKAPESGKGPTSSATLENSHRKHLESDMPASYTVRIDDSSGRKIISHQVPDSGADSNNGSNSYDNESGHGIVGEEFASVAGVGGTHMMHQEEQDLLNMMTSPTTEGFSGQNQIPVNLAPGHIPLPLSPSILASMGYAHRNVGNIPLIESFNWGTNVQFPQGLVPSPWTPYFPGMGLTSNPEDLIETGNENFNTVEMGPAEADKDFWHEQERAAARGIDVDNVNFEMVPDDKRQSTSGGYKFIPSSHVGSSSNSAILQPTFTKENRVSTKEEHIDSPKYQDGRGNGAYFDERIANPRLPSEPSSSSFRSKTSSESSWEGPSPKSSKSTREKRGKKNTSSVTSAAYGKGKNVSDISSNLVDDENRQWTPLSTTTSDMSDRSTGPLAVAPMHVPRQPVSGSEVVRTSGSDSVSPMAPMLIGHGSRQRTGDNSGVVPFAFYPTGPPVPFVTMLPLYNFPTTQSSHTPASNFHVEDADNNDRGQSFDPSEVHDLPEVLSSSNSMGRAAIDTVEPKLDILNGDFVSHWQNLQYGRICQNSRHPDSVNYPSSVVVPPVYLQSRFPWDGPGRPQSANANLFTQLMNYGPHLVPVAPLHSVSNRPANIYQRFIDEIPRYRSGTGTYLPNPKVSVRDRHSTSTRRGNHNYDRSDQHGDREGNWNVNSKSRTSGRSHYRSQAERSSSRPEKLATSESHSERPWGSHRPDSFVSHQSGPVRLNSSQSNLSNLAYGMYSLPGLRPSGISSNGPTIPPVVMWYSYDHNAGYSTPAEQLEFGTLGPMGFPGVNEVSLINEGSQPGGAFEEQRFNGGTAQQSSPDQPASPKFRRL
ncbi:DNA polymerase sigma subunit [Vigna unguiculata]|uniref:DNA polymerase sigma subunit n=1 Tax=Vigna unguiculata TaxID=3917 RepID=A0A4D6KR03_VIGUN|nr:DNA polymerase sigma subunit [Vigna unguiculata]